MVNRTYNPAKVSGFTLIEALIAMAVFSFGLLAVAKFQAALVADSAQSKARSEAIQLAQQKMDEIRGYTTEEQLVANLKNIALTADEKFPEHAFGNLPTLADDVAVTDCDFTVSPQPYTTVADSNNPLSGNNASYTRQWKYCMAGPELIYAVVDVSWDDAKGVGQMVSLDTEVTKRDPRGAADLTVNDFEPLVPSATGRAYLGDSTISAEDLADALTDGTAEDNLDGTLTVEGDTDLYLVDDTLDDGEYNVVLTLEDACVTDTCIDFVKISGRIYKDMVDAPTVTLANVFVLASDAAYCARVNADAPVGSDAEGNSDGFNDYEYFDYTCYLGGGWHGNIGVLLNDGGNQDLVCVGDPTSLPPSDLSDPTTDDGDPTNNWKQVELATRRVYRGMTYKGDVDTVINDTTYYYSQGIGDAVVLPDSTWSERSYGHDFVVTRIVGTATASRCIDALTRADSDTDGDGALDGGEMGDIFYGVATDFVCLNEDEDTDPVTFKYLDTFMLDHYAKDYCPYDPSRGPALAYYITGTVSVPPLDVLDGSKILNTVNAENCSFVDIDLNPIDDITGENSAPYACLIYDWGDGWTGSVYVDEGFGITCPDPIAFSGVSSDQTANFACATLAQPTISGTLTAYLNDLTGTTVEAVRENADGTQETIDCGAPTMSASGDTAEWGCTVAEEVLNGGWIGTVTVTPPADIACVGDLSLTWSTGSELTADSTGNDYFCTGPVTQLTVSGTISGVEDLSALAVPTVSSSTDGACSVAPVAASWDYTYECPVTFDYVSGWSGFLTITPSTDMTCSGDLSPGLNNVTTNTSVTELIECTVDDVVVIRGEVLVFWPYDIFTPDTTALTTIDVTMLGSGGSVDGICQLDSVPSSGDPIGATHQYTCVTNGKVNVNQGWSGTVNYKTNGTNWAVMCSPSLVDPLTLPATGSFSYDSLLPGSVLTANAFVDEPGWCSIYP